VTHTCITEFVGLAALEYISREIISFSGTKWSGVSMPHSENGLRDYIYMRPQSVFLTLACRWRSRLARVPRLATPW